jgi:arginine metabolism regulation protein II
MRNTLRYRALINVYVYYRIIMGSICFATGRCTRGFSNGSLERFSVTEGTLEVGLDPTVEKTFEVGYNNIHLGFHGKWQETLYTKIYGVPETLLTLLSQTVKLANGK